MRVCRTLVGLLFLMLVAGPPPAAYGETSREGAFIGLDLGVGYPANDNFQDHVKTGGTGAPFAGYMFNDYIGLLGQYHIMFFSPDNDERRFTQPDINNENQYTTISGWTVGPRINVPLFDHLLDAYATVQGGAYKGMGGRVNQWAPGFLAGGGIDFYITPQFSIGGFGRWNRAYMSPHPYRLYPSFTVAGQPPENYGPSDIRWAMGGVSIKYAFVEEAAPPPPPPPPPPPTPVAAPPVKKKIVLRAVHFDFDKANIRRDAIPVLDEAVSVLKQEPDRVGVIAIGHTDSIGTEAYNLKLSMRRAEAVRNYLVSKGIASARIKVEGRGEAEPVASNSTADGRAQNRRVELRLTE